MTDRATVRGLVAACLAASLMPLNSTMIAVAVPDIAAEVSHGPGTVTQALVTTYLVAAIALQSPGGRLGDRLGQWRVLSLGQMLLGVGALLGFVAPTLFLLALSRVLMAAGGAIIVPATVALIRLELPPDRRGRAFGMFGAAMSLAAGMGPIVGGELVRAFGWQAIFLANLPVLALAALIASGARRTTTPVPAQTRFDWVGSALLTAALAAVVLGLQAAPSPASVMLLTLGTMLFLPFVWWERRLSDPVVAFVLFRSATFTAGTLLITLLNLVMYALLFEIPQLTDALFGLGAQHTGRLLVFMMLAMVGTSLLAGRLVDRFGARLIALAGTLACLVSTVLLLVGPAETPDELRLPLTLLGLGLGLANPAAQTAALADVARAHSGMAAGLGSTMRYLGGIVGVVILGRVVHADGPRSTLLDQHQVLMTVFVAVLLLGLGCVRFLPGTAAGSQAGVRGQPDRR